jgi:hypothetical protein
MSESVYATCAALTPGDASATLECVSTSFTDTQEGLATGLNSFFLIFAGALVLYVFVGTTDAAYLCVLRTH